MRNEYKITENVIVVFDKVPDGFGFLRDTCEVIQVLPNGHRVVYPTLPPVKVTTQRRDEPLLTHSKTRFTKKDAFEVYAQMKDNLP